MTILLSMPGGSEWILIFIVFSLFIIIPALTIIYYMRYKQAKEDLAKMTMERDELLRRLLDKKES